MKLLKYFSGSLIISLGLLIVLAIIVRAIGISLPPEISRYFLLAWVLLAIIIMPFTSKIIRVE